MWLNQLFIENPIDFEKRCRNRIVFGICFILLGAAAIGLSFAVRNRAMVMYLEQGYREFMPGFYGGTGFGLAAAGTASIIRNLQYLRNPELKEKRRIYETDERNRMLGLHRIYHDVHALYRRPGKRVYQYDSCKDADICGCTVCSTVIGVQTAFGEGHVRALFFSIASGFVLLKTMGHRTQRIYSGEASSVRKQLSVPSAAIMRCAAVFSQRNLIWAQESIRNSASASRAWWQARWLR